MRIAIIAVIGGIVGIGLLIRLARMRIVPARAVTLRDIPEIISQLDRSGQNGNFAVLMFVPPGSTNGEAVNLQYSIENGTVGMDWVLLAPRNIADKDAVRDFASRLGYRLEEHEMNDVRYLRVTGRGVSDLGVKIVRDFYHISPEAKLEMITEGFKWQQS